MFALTVPGLGELAAKELADVPGVRVTGQGDDGRANLITFTIERRHISELMHVRLVEDLFLETGQTKRGSRDRAAVVASRLWHPAVVQQALSVWSTQHRLTSGMTFRVIARLLNERVFLRTELRHELTALIARERPRWMVKDPARIEVWASEYQPDRFIAGIRLTSSGFRQHDGRTVERQGALRPVVAAAMVRLAGGGRTLFDPCCGSGTILREALQTGWVTLGSDIDPDAVDAARVNVPGAAISVADARNLDMPNASVDACVSNLPFGRQFHMQGDRHAWLAAVLTAMSQATRPGGHVVLLVPDIPRSAIPSELSLCSRHHITLLGANTAIWVFRNK